MTKKRPCSLCRKWFEPDARVGKRQRTCSAKECQRKRRTRTQAAWRLGRPDYGYGRLLAERVADQAKAKRDLEPLPVQRPLDRVPWQHAVDEMGFKTADFLWVFGKVIVQGAKDQIRIYLADLAGESPGHPPGAVKDQIAAGA
jgi:hypothetical protein